MIIFICSLLLALKIGNVLGVLVVFGLRVSKKVLSFGEFVRSRQIKGNAFFKRCCLIM